MSASEPLATAAPATRSGRSPLKPPAFRGHPYLIITAVIVGLALLRAVYANDLLGQNLFNTWMYYTVVVVGFWFVFGVSGQFAFSQAAFAALGAYTSIWATSHGRPFLFGFLLAGLVCGVIAALFALLIRRAEHFYFAIATLGLSEVILLVMRTWKGFTHGGELSGIKPISLFGWSVTGTGRDTKVFYVLLAMVAIVLVIATLLERSPVVREAMAMRDRPLVARTVGLPVVRIRVAMYVLGTVIAGMAGSTAVHWRGSVTPDQFGVELSLAIFLMLILGGTGSKYGPLLGAAFYVYAQQFVTSLDDRFASLKGGSFDWLYGWLTKLDQYWPIVYGTLLILVMVALPDGILGLVDSIRRRLRRRRSPAGTSETEAVATDGADAPDAVIAPLSSAGDVSAPDAAVVVAESSIGDTASPLDGRPVLSATGIAVRFGGVRAVDGIDLQLRRGEILGLVGPNGSGKSTLLNAITGVVPATGRLEVDGKPVALGRPARARWAGMLRTFQTPQSFPALTSLENAMVTLPSRQRTGVTAALVLNPLVRRDERPRWAAGGEALDEVDMRDRADRLPTELSYGEQRMLELARVEAGQASIVLLDEPSAGLNAAETTELASRLMAMRARGMSLVLVDHKIDFIQEVCDRVVVLELGRVVAEGDPVGIWRDERVVDVYLGTAPTVDDGALAVDPEGGG